MRRASLYSAIVVPVLMLPGHVPPRHPKAPPPPPARFVAEAVIADDGTSQPQVYLPVTVHGHPGTLLLHFFQAQAKVLLSDSVVQQWEIGNGATLDSLTIGKTVAHELSFATITLSATPPPGLPPVIGVAGNEFLDDYDIVVDGPARRVRLYARVETGGTTVVPGDALPPGITHADCVPTRPMPEGHTGFPIQANGRPMMATMQTAAGGLTIMNLVAAKVLGLTQHSPNVRYVPDTSQTLAYQGVPNKYVATGVTLTLGRYRFRDDPVYILARTPLQPSDTTPSMELTFANLLDQLFVQSVSTGQVCLADPHAHHR